MDYFITEDHSGKKQHVGIVVWMYLIVLLEHYALVLIDSGFEFFSSLNFWNMVCSEFMEKKISLFWV